MIFVLIFVVDFFDLRLCDSIGSGQRVLCVAVGDTEVGVAVSGIAVDR